MPHRHDDHTEYTATCAIEHQVYNPQTNDWMWQPYESVTITEPTIERLTERAFLYIGRPERIPNVHAIRLTGNATLMRQEQDAYYAHTNSASISLHILRERSQATSVNQRNVVPLHASSTSMQNKPKQVINALYL